MKIHITLTLLISVLFSSGSFSQLQFGIGFIGGFPTGEFDDINNFGPGIYLEGKFGVNDKSNIGLEVSGIYFTEIDPSGTSTLDPTVMIPILITGDYYFLEARWTPYAGLGVGPYIIDNEFTNKTKVGVNPRVGVFLGSLKLGVGYHIVNDFNFFSFQVGYLSREKRK